MKKVVKKLSLVYYLIYIATILVVLLGFQLIKAGYSIDDKSDMGIGISSVLIILIIGSIPFTLAYFNKMTKKWALIIEPSVQLKTYEKGAIIRLLIIGIGLLLAMFSFAIMKSQSMLFCGGIAAIALFFCKPSEIKIISELKLDEVE